ncbi:protein slit-like isoform X1 [Diabrotica virgifera virgifera]|uniref:Uncharacterized protein n=2 Tax=Diabrotica virgifera virgifera TaxID=50390 RepID=A0ABM5KQE2_DIAVI|nr:protein slit-like isoform X1 [Diabrotica virgifera virgifera]
MEDNWHTLNEKGKMRLLLVMSLISTLDALHCDKEFNFIDSVYEKGYDIICQGLTNNYTTLLSDIHINYEISLTMENCSLTGVTSDLFKNVVNIKRLSISNSTFSFPPTEHIFEHVNQLEELVVINTRFKPGATSMADLPNLTKLTLRQNSLNSLEKNSFKKLEKLQSLQVTQNNLVDISNLFLCANKYLKSLNFSNNSIEHMGEVFFCEDQVTEPVFSVNSAKRSVGASFTYYRPSITFTDLYEIDFSHNNIEYLSNSFAFLKSLKVIKLQGNKITKLNSSHFSFLDYLEELKISDNNINSVEDDLFIGKIYLEKLDLSNNKLSQLNLQYLNCVKSLNLGSNEFDVKYLLSINTTNVLKTLKLYNNNIRDIPPNTFTYYAYLKHLDLSNNHIKLVELSFHGLTNLTHLEIRNNSIAGLPKNVFKTLKNLKILDMSQNELSVIHNNDIFVDQKNLEVLNLSRNSLTELSYPVFKNLKNLNTLDVTHNKLHVIEYDKLMTSLPSLILLDIKFNDLSCALLSKLVDYLKFKNVSYTLQKNEITDKMNIGGIFCRDEEAGALMRPKDTHVMFNISLALVIILLVVVLGIIAFKVHIYLKRRNYMADEFELVED